MRYVFEWCLILLITLLGEALARLLPLPVPASVYGLVLMLLCLQLKIVKIERVERTAGFLLRIMPVLFIPAAVGLMDLWPQMKSMLLPALVIVPLTTLLVMAISGRAAQWAMRRDGR